MRDEIVNSTHLAPTMLKLRETSCSYVYANNRPKNSNSIHFADMNKWLQEPEAINIVRKWQSSLFIEKVPVMLHNICQVLIQHSRYKGYQRQIKS